MHHALRKGPLFTKTPSFSTFFTKPPHFISCLRACVGVFFAVFELCYQVITHTTSKLQEITVAVFGVSYNKDFLLRHTHKTR